MFHWPGFVVFSERQVTEANLLWRPSDAGSTSMNAVHSNHLMRISCAIFWGITYFFNTCFNTKNKNSNDRKLKASAFFSRLFIINFLPDNKNFVLLFVTFEPVFFWYLSSLFFLVRFFIILEPTMEPRPPVPPASPSLLGQPPQPMPFLYVFNVL